MAIPTNNYDGFDDLAQKYVEDIQAEQVGITPPNFTDADTTTLSDGYAFNDIDLSGSVNTSDAIAVLSHISNINVIDATYGAIYDHFLEVLSYYDPESTDGTLSKTANHGPCMSLRRIRDEYKSTTGVVSFSDFVRGGSYVTDQPENATIPTTTTNSISFADFYGTKKARTVTYEIIGGGGGGGSGWLTANNGTAGQASTLSGSGFSTISSPGGAGGRGGIQTGWSDGSSSYYGAGGAGGANSDSGNQTAGYPAPSTSYGAGGGGGGAAPFSARNGGEGGYAGGANGSAYNVYAWNSGSYITRYVGQPNTGTLELTPGQQITIVVGAAGTNISSDPGTDGRAGAGGYCKLTISGVDYEYTTPGTYTFTVPS